VCVCVCVCVCVIKSDLSMKYKPHARWDVAIPFANCLCFSWRQMVHFRGSVYIQQFNKISD